MIKNPLKLLFIILYVFYAHNSIRALRAYTGAKAVFCASMKLAYFHALTPRRNLIQLCVYTLIKHVYTFVPDPDGLQKNGPVMNENIPVAQ